jgi:carbamoyltransferase
VALTVLGITNDETSSACVMVDGELIAAASEERFTRVKMDKSFPVRAIDDVLQAAGLSSVREVDVVAYSWFKGMDADLVPALADRILLEQRTNPDGLELLLERLRWEVDQCRPNRTEFEHWASAQGVDDRVVDFYHHEAHALSAALVAPFDDGLVVTCDGRGDFESSAVWEFDRRRDPAIIKRTSAFSNDSLGYFYGRITGLLGFRPHRHEGKVTGLAAYGDPTVARDLMHKMIRFEDGAIRAYNGPWYRPFFAPYSEELVERVRSHRREDIAAAAQVHLEEIIADLVRHHLPKDREVDVALAGGVFANVRANQVVKELDGVRQVFVQPHMADGGLCIGAAAGATHARGVRVHPMRTARLGPASPPVPDEDLRPFRVTSAVTEEALVELVIERLAASKVVGAVRGRMEFGPRALCSRSLLYRTSDRTVNDWLNERLHRTEFMPFAPVTTVELGRESFVGFDPDDPTMPFMTSTIRCTEAFAAACPAVTHVDGTARPQIVTAESDPFMHALVTAWHAHSGEMSLINTSFNMHEEPIILDAMQGLDALRREVIDVLLLDDRIVERDEA